MLAKLELSVALSRLGLAVTANSLIEQEIMANLVYFCLSFCSTAIVLYSKWYQDFGTTTDIYSFNTVMQRNAGFEKLRHRM